MLSPECSLWGEPLRTRETNLKFQPGGNLVHGPLDHDRGEKHHHHIVVLKQSGATDQITWELSRIADALERIANRPADDATGGGTWHQHQWESPLQRESQRVAYSMFGR